MRVTRHAYVVEGWGVGELWEADGRLVVAHAAPEVRAAAVPTTGPAPGPARAEAAAGDVSSSPNWVVAADEPPTRPRGTPGVPTETLASSGARVGDDFVPNLLGRVHRFYAGERVDLADVPLDLEWCTPFQRAVAEALRHVPWGELVTYAELAALAGHLRAQRAVGTFCAGNRFSLFLPCHRVVAADGIGSYGPGGVGRKRRLLRLEGHAAL